MADTAAVCDQESVIWMKTGILGGVDGSDVPMALELKTKELRNLNPVVIPKSG